MLAVLGVGGTTGNTLVKVLPLIIAFAVLSAYTYLVGVRPGTDRVRQGFVDLHDGHRGDRLHPGQAGRLGANLQHRIDAPGQGQPRDRQVVRRPHRAPASEWVYGSLALGLFVHPHAITGAFAAKRRDMIRRNAALLPAYSLMLGLIALFGYLARAVPAVNAGVKAVGGNAHSMRWSAIPHFIGGKKVSGALGTDFREYLKQRVARDKPGNADLCSYFLLRDLSVARRGRVGIIATNTIAQGDTREVGLDQAVDVGWCIYRAEKSQPWPGSATLEVSLLWTGHPGKHEHRILDGRAVATITPSLDTQTRIIGNPHRLTANVNQAFIGSLVLGTGFILEPGDAKALITKDPRNKAVLFPYLNGEDLNSRWDCSARRWVINFHDWSIEEAQQYADVFHIVERKVRPQRNLLPDYKRRVRENWWMYEHQARKLYELIADFNRVLVIARVSKTGLPQFTATTQVMSEQAVVFASGQSSRLALLSSSMHFFWWTTKGESSLRVDPRYTPSDGFETFPQPKVTEWMDSAGEQLHAFRQTVMERRRVGLTSLYNLVHDRAVSDPDIARLRELHLKIDEAVREAYALDEEREPGIQEFEARVASAPLPAWREIELGHGFHETRQGVRFTISPQARADVLDKLLALNHYRYQQEVERGLHAKKGRAAAKRRASGRRGPSAPASSALF